MRFVRHCTVALLALSIGAGAERRPAEAGSRDAQPPSSAPVPGEATFSIFVRGTTAGREQVNVARSGPHWVITSTGRLGDLVINRFEVKYTDDWQPVELKIEATQGQKKLQLATSFGVTTAINEITQDAVTTAKTDQVSARTIVLPNNFFAGYEALAARLAGSKAGDELPIYVAPQAEVKLSVRSVTDQALQTPAGTLATRRYEIALHNPGATLEGTVVVDDKSRLARLELPAAGLTVVRNDLSSVAVRPQTARNPTDSDVTIPGNGFNLAGTLTLPPRVGRLRHPALVLVPGSGPVDRDETVAGIPIFSQLAGELAQRGFLVLRYDKRGVGQSGGRTESATLQDYSDDLVAIVRWLSKRDDVDTRRITIAGHSEGGFVAMLAAAREKKIDALVLMATPGSTGAELILEQQQHQLDLLKISSDERRAKEDLQRKIQQAVVTGKGWEGLPPELRKQADIPWFRSLLQFDPAAVLRRFKQPILIVQPDLDAQVLPHHAEKLAELAGARKNAGAVHVVHLPGVNHLLVPAKTGEVQEYGALGDRISPLVVPAIADWLAGLS